MGQPTFIMDGAPTVCVASPQDIQRRAVVKLDVLNAAQELMDLRSPPANRLEALSGDWAGFYSIRVNEQWRIVFRWENGNASAVQLVDYH